MAFIYMLTHKNNIIGLFNPDSSVEEFFRLNAYKKWTELGIERTLKVIGVVEFRRYQTVASPSDQIVVTYEFTDLTAWAKWYSHEEIQKVRDELNMLVTDFSADLWEMSPIVPMPVRP